MVRANFDAVQAHVLPDGVRYVLPKRDLGPLRWVGVAIAASSLFFMAPAARSILTQGQSGWGPFDLIFVVIPLLMGLVPIALGLMIYKGHCEIVVTRDRVRVTERAGLFRWSRSKPRDVIKHLEVLHSSRKNPLAAENPLSDLAAIKADCGNKGPFLLAAGYPVALLRGLADELAERLDRPSRNKLVDDRDEPGVTVRERVISSSDLSEESDRHRHDVFDQPADSRVTFDEIDGGISLNVPPAGVIKGSKGLIFMAVFWLVITGGITTAMALSQDAPWFVFLFMSLFWAAGIGMLVAAIHMGRRRAVLDVIGDTLLVTESGLFGTKQHEWPADQIRDVRMGFSGMKVNNKPVMQLRIQPVAGEKLGIFTGRKKDELRWLATTLRQALGMNVNKEAGNNTADSPNDG